MRVANNSSSSSIRTINSTRFKALSILSEARSAAAIVEESLLMRIHNILKAADTLDEFVTTAGAALDMVGASTVQLLTHGLPPIYNPL